MKVRNYGVLVDALTGDLRRAVRKDRKARKRAERKLARMRARITKDRSAVDSAIRGIATARSIRRYDRAAWQHCKTHPEQYP